MLAIDRIARCYGYGRASWVDILADVGELEINLVVDFLHDGQDQVAESVL